MAVNKNFVVKNGLEVATNAVLVDATSKNVGIGSTLPTNTLDVRGGIGATDIIVTGVSYFKNTVGCVSPPHISCCRARSRRTTVICKYCL